MSRRFDDLQALARMLADGEISQAEYDTVEAELIAAPASDWEGEIEDPPISDGVEYEEPTEISDEIHAGDGLAFGSLFHHIRAAPRPYLLGATALLFLSVAVVGLRDEQPPPVIAAPVPPSAPEPEDPPAASLGVRFDRLREEWNSFDRPPSIRRAITVTPEPGPLDGFLYRFDDASLLAGAYDPSDGYLYALMVRVGLFHSSSANFYLHLCHLLHPGDAGCIGAYISRAGVYEATITEFADVDHEASWTYAGNRWSFTLVDNIQTIRVLAPGE